MVLKVGGNEVTELSTGSSGHDSGLFEDKNDHDKHKDRKRKKRKKGEKQVPGEEKGRKRRRVKVKGVAWPRSPGLASEIGLVSRWSGAEQGQESPRQCSAAL